MAGLRPLRRSFGVLAAVALLVAVQGGAVAGMDDSAVAEVGDRALGGIGDNVVGGVGDSAVDGTDRGAAEIEADATGPVGAPAAATTDVTPTSDAGPRTAAASSASSAAAASAAAVRPASANRATASRATALQADPTVVERVEYRRASDGRLEATVTYDVPASVSALEFRFDQSDLEVVETDGFERTGSPDLSWRASAAGPTFAWDGATDAPQVVVRHDVDVGGQTTRSAGDDDWAIAQRPSTHARWRYSGPEPGFAYDAAVDGEGVAGEQFVLLGAHEVHETTAAGERLRLVVPEAATMRADPDRVLASIADASRRLQVGERSDVVTIVASPSDADWAHRGLSLGADARVSADEPVDRAPNLWIHEYVHTRQDRSSTTPETEWLVEATAEYYAATVPYERGDVDFDAYRRALADGADGARGDAVLAEPDSWGGQAQYHKGALVVAAIDRQLRDATDGDVTFQAAFRAWNRADEFTGDDLAAELGALGGPSVREFAEEHVETSATPSFWDRSRHRATFDVDRPVSAAGGSSLASTGGEGGAGASVRGADGDVRGEAAREPGAQRSLSDRLVVALFGDDAAGGEAAGERPGAAGGPSAGGAGDAVASAGDALATQLHRSGLAAALALVAVVGLAGALARP